MMPKAVRFWNYGGPEVLRIVEVPKPRPAAGEILIQVVAAALNPGEIGIREGVFASIWPAHFPEGQGNDFAGVVSEVGDDVDAFTVGNEVLGFAPRAAQAEFVLATPDSLTLKPPKLSWEAAASIAGAGATAWAAVQAVDPQPDDTVVVSAAAGGVGNIAAQLVRLRGARVIGTSSEENFAFLHSQGIYAVRYGSGLAERLREAAPEGIDAYIDTFGSGNVRTGIELGVRPSRINTSADGSAVSRYGVRSDAQEEAASPEIWAELALLVDRGDVRVAIAAAYDLEHVQQAYRDVATRHGAGKRILKISPAPLVEQ